MDSQQVNYPKLRAMTAVPETDPAYRPPAYPNPEIRVKGPGDSAMYPKMKPDGRGGWMFSDPASVADFMEGKDLPPAPMADSPAANSQP
jgi:hypothetical protein